MINHIPRFIARLHPAKILLICYILYGLFGWFVLMMPICHKLPVSAIDHFFTAISAVSTSGLSTIDVGSTYTFFGQAVILLLIQVGGIGYMTFNSFIILATTNRLSRFSKKIISAEFPIPKDFVIQEFILHVILFTLFCEIVGAVALSLVFQNHGVDNFIWNAVFHSVSAFCTAGFSLFPDSLMSFRYSLGVNGIISLLSILGAIGFITWLNFYKKAIGEKQSISFTAKVILYITFLLIGLGTLTFVFTEHFTADGSVFKHFMTAFFQVMTASTTCGFNTLDISTLKQTSLVLLLFLMSIGASPSGTGGGLKTTTFVALIGLVKSTLNGEKVMSFWKREIPPKRLQLATATFSYYILVLILSVFVLLSIENKPFLSVLFEAASALGTNGLSMGITHQLSEVGKFLIAILMVMGKIGIMTFGIALAGQVHKKIVYREDNELVF